MQKAFEYEAKFDRNGRQERRFSIGPALIWGLVALISRSSGQDLCIAIHTASIARKMTVRMESTICKRQGDRVQKANANFDNHG